MCSVWCFSNFLLKKTSFFDFFLVLVCGNNCFNSVETLYFVCSSLVFDLDLWRISSGVSSVIPKPHNILGFWKFPMPQKSHVFSLKKVFPFFQFKY